LKKAGHPEAVFKGQAVERGDVIDGGGNVFSRRGSDGGGDGG
jgi:hypothetical protein